MHKVNEILKQLNMTFSNFLKPIEMLKRRFIKRNKRAL